MNKADVISALESMKNGLDVMKLVVEYRSKRGEDYCSNVFGPRTLGCDCAREGIACDSGRCIIYKLRYDFGCVTCFHTVAEIKNALGLGETGDLTKTIKRIVDCLDYDAFDYCDMEV